MSDDIAYYDQSGRGNHLLRVEGTPVIMGDTVRIRITEPNAIRTGEPNRTTVVYPCTCGTTAGLTCRAEWHRSYHKGAEPKRKNRRDRRKADALAKKKPRPGYYRLPDGTLVVVGLEESGKVDRQVWDTLLKLKGLK